MREAEQVFFLFDFIDEKTDILQYQKLVLFKSVAFFLCN